MCDSCNLRSILSQVRKPLLSVAVHPFIPPSSMSYSTHTYGSGLDECSYYVARSDPATNSIVVALRLLTPRQARCLGANSVEVEAVAVAGTGPRSARSAVGRSVGSVPERNARTSAFPSSSFAVNDVSVTCVVRERERERERETGAHYTSSQ